MLCRSPLMLLQQWNLYIWIFRDGNGTDGWKFCFRVTFLCKLCTVWALGGEGKAAIKMRATHCQPSAISHVPPSFLLLFRSRKALQEGGFPAQISVVLLMLAWPVWFPQPTLLRRLSLCYLRTMLHRQQLLAWLLPHKLSASQWNVFIDVCGKYH